MSAIKKGTTVRQIMPAPIVGVVVGYKVDGEDGHRLTEVAFINEEGEQDSRFFRDGEFEEALAEDPADETDGA